MGSGNTANRSKYAIWAAEKAQGRRESTSTKPTIEPCPKIGTAIAERRLGLVLVNSLNRKSAFASSQSTDLPVSRHFFAIPESTRDPTGGASPALAQQRAP